jgi:hypothetical protein
MAKLKKRILRWQASSSPQVIGYKLYWSESGDFNPKCLKKFSNLHHIKLEKPFR